MREENNGSAKAYDPFESFRGMRDAYLDALSKSMIETVNTESYAEVTGAMLDSYLTVSAPLRENLEKAMTQMLQQLSLPSRQEVAVLAQRFTNFEMRLDDMDAKLDRLAMDLADDRKAKADSQHALADIIGSALREHSLGLRKEVADLAKNISQLQTQLEDSARKDVVPNSNIAGTAQNSRGQAAMKLEEGQLSAVAKSGEKTKLPAPLAQAAKRTVAATKESRRSANAGNIPR